MGLLRIVPMFFIFLVLSVGQTILMVNQSEARACNPYKNEPPPKCTPMWYLVHGSVKQLDQKDNKFLIKINNDFSLVVKATQEVAYALKREFKSEKVTESNGFLVVTKTKKDKQLLLAAFIPSPLNPDMTVQSVSESVEQYNRAFEAYVQQINTSYQK